MVAAITIATSLIAVGLSSPSLATDGITQNAIGTYKYRDVKQKKVTRSWILTPCGDGANQCVEVAVFNSNDRKRRKPLLNGRAYWTVGSWIMFIDEKLKCKGGAVHDVNVNYSWDAASNIGYRSYFDPGLCGGSKPKSVAAPFKLIKTGPPPPAATPSESPPPAPAEAVSPPPPAP